MNSKIFQRSTALVLTTLLLGACGLLEPFADALAAACEQEQFTVTKYADTNDGICTPDDCSLREAIITANNCPGTDTIVLSPGTYALTIEGADEDEAATGDLDVSDNLSIEGRGAVIDGHQTDRILDIQAQVEGEQLVFVAYDLRLQNGNAHQGGAIRNAGLAQFGNTVVSNNRAQRGGALFNTGLLTISGEITGNQATEASPGALNAGSLEIRDSIVSENHLERLDPEAPGGCGERSSGVENSGDLTILRTTIAENNDACGIGYGILNTGSRVRIDRSTIENHASQGLRDDSSSSELEISYTTIRGNAKGALDLNGAARVENSTFSGNGGNLMASGGGLCGTVNNLGSLSMVNVTLSGNHAIADFPADCTVLVNGGSLELRYVTLYDNAFTGIAEYNLRRTPETHVLGSLLGQNGRANCLFAPGFVSGGENLSDDDSCLLGSDDQVRAGENLRLGPLADNGSLFGPQTLALLLGSPAINAAGLECPPADERGIARPRGSRCDVGAYELDESFITIEPESPLPGPEVRLVRDALCYTGPGDPYPVVSSLLGGSTARVLGLGAREDWLVIENPRLHGVNCWVNRDDVEEPEAYDLSGLTVFAIPPLPTPAPRPEKATGCLVQNPNDPKQVICVPRACTPNDQPGGSCTP